MKRQAGSVLLLAFSLAAGCGGEKPGGGVAGAGELSIAWAQWQPADALDALAKDFTKETGVRVTVSQTPWPGYKDKMFVEFSKRSDRHDIVVGDSQWLGEGATKGHYLEITDWLPAHVDLSKISPSALRFFCEYPAGSGRYYAAPCETDAVGFAYRKDWFEDPKEKEAFHEKHGRELAPPETWDEFRDVASFFTRPDAKRYGCAILTGRSYDAATMGFQQLMWAYGGSYGDPKTFEVEGLLNSPETLAAMEFYRSLLAFSPKGGSNYAYEDCTQNFSNGLTAMTMNYFAFYPQMVKDLGEEKVGFFVVPGVRREDGAVRRAVSLGGQGFSIVSYASDAKKELAKRFIEWFSKKEQQEKWVALGGFTANDEVLKSAAFAAASPYNAAFAASLPYLQDFWAVPEFGELVAGTQKYFGQAIDGAMEPKAALDALAKEHEEIFRRAGYRK